MFYWISAIGFYSTGFDSSIGFYYSTTTTGLTSSTGDCLGSSAWDCFGSYTGAGLTSGIGSCLGYSADLLRSYFIIRSSILSSSFFLESGAGWFIDLDTPDGGWGLACWDLATSLRILDLWDIFSSIKNLILSVLKFSGSPITDSNALSYAFSIFNA